MKTDIERLLWESMDALLLPARGASDPLLPNEFAERIEITEADIEIWSQKLERFVQAEALDQAEADADKVVILIAREPTLTATVQLRRPPARTGTDG